MTDEANPWAACAARLAALDPAGPALAAGLRALVWLAGERAAAPHAVRRGRGRAVVFRWDQAGHWFEVAVGPAGGARWRVGAGDRRGPGGRRLDRAAAEALRAAIPFAGRFPGARPDGRAADNGRTGRLLG